MISSIVSAGSFGFVEPVFDFLFQKRRKPTLCRRSNVSGCTISSAFCDKEKHRVEGDCSACLTQSVAISGADETCSHHRASLIDERRAIMDQYNAADQQAARVRQLSPRIRKDVAAAPVQPRTSKNLPPTELAWPCLSLRTNSPISSSQTGDSARSCRDRDYQGCGQKNRHHDDRGHYPANICSGSRPVHGVRQVARVCHRAFVWLLMQGPISEQCRRGPTSTGEWVKCTLELRVRRGSNFAENFSRNPTMSILTMMRAYLAGYIGNIHAKNIKGEIVSDVLYCVFI